MIAKGDRVLYNKKLFTVTDVWYDGQDYRAMIVNRRNHMYTVLVSSLVKEVRNEK